MTTVYFYVFMEWLFFATKPSFLNILSNWKSVAILLNSALVIFAEAWILEALLFCALIKFQTKPIIASFFVIPSLFLAITALLMVDNFTYTVFQFGIISTGTALALSCLLVFIGFFLLILRKLAKSFHLDHERRLFKGIGGVLLGLSFIPFILGLFHANPKPAVSNQTGVSSNQEVHEKYNIILFASDGIDADHLSAYGYHRDTTPHLNRYVSSARVMENTVTNGTPTSISIMSMLTGKFPTTTRFLSTGHMLTGDHVFQHLPGILKSYGYRSIQESVRFFADSHDSNMQMAFDVANGRTISDESFRPFPRFLKAKFSNEEFFVSKIQERVSERMLHMVRIKDMVNSYALMVSEKLEEVDNFWKLGDEKRIEDAISFIKETNEPYFVHIHLHTLTHCIWVKNECRYRPRMRQFSEISDKSSDDAYDDAILGSDRLFGELMSWLETNDQLENTIIVYTSDHGSAWNLDHRVPLIFIFPDGNHKGRSKKSAQLVDVAPTLLDYLEIPIPEWMEGDSLLRPEELDDLRPLYTVRDNKRRKAASFFGLGGFRVNLCHKWFELNYPRATFRSGNIINHTAPCPDDAFPPVEQIQIDMKEHLRTRSITESETG